MARYTGPKDRLSRREGVDLFGAGSKLTRLNVIPGMHGTTMRRGPSQYGRQLREKQKVKRMYGIMERQFVKYAKLALMAKGNTGDTLLSLLERRLDNVVYRLGLASSRPAARQIVGHGHIKVNGQKVTIPSYQVSVGDVIQLSPKIVEAPSVTTSLNNKSYTPPAWLVRDGMTGKIDRLPQMADVVEPISVQDIIEFYSR